MKQLKKIVKIGLITIGLILLVGGIYAYFFYQNIKKEIVQQDDGLNHPSVVQYANEKFDQKAQYSLEKYDFQLSQFANPELKYGPYTRWWWPGNDVDSAELKKEIEGFVEQGIAGVEIQPSGTGLNSKTEANRFQRVNSWDTPSYYKNIQVVLEKAQQAGLTVDLNSTGGWPTGGTHIALQDNFKNLLFSEKNVTGGKLIQTDIEYPSPGFTSFMAPLARKIYDNPLVKGGKMYLKHAKLETVVAYKVIDNQRSQNIFDVSNQVKLDLTSATVLDSFCQNQKLTWTAPQGNWQIVAFWSLPADEHPVLTPTTQQAYVVDHFDSTKVKANYNYLFGKRTGLEKYYGKSLRAIFNDSYEFAVNRHFTADFFAFFKQRRGYDIRPYLPANMIPGYNHVYFHALGLKNQSAFAFGQEDWRLVNDYDLTISELFEEHFLKSTKNWLNNRGMLHRTQAYGLPLDNIKAASYIDIPETEHLYGDNAYAFIKMISSGGYLYNRPLVSSESMVFENMDYMTTPLKIKATLDKAFCNGVNQTIYHGTAYSYFNEDFGQYGWFPWSSPHSPMMNYAFDYRSKNPISQYMPAINQYVRRTQYALQSGKPKKDVLIYYPFLGIGYEKGINDPNEILKKGYFEGYEPYVIDTSNKIPFLTYEKDKAPKIQWLQNLYPTIHKIEAAGLDWSWVNNHSILDASVENGRINIRGNLVDKIILPNLPYIPLEVLKKLDGLAKQGANIVFMGTLPNKQPSYNNFKTNDLEVNQIIERSIKNHTFKFEQTLQNSKTDVAFDAPTNAVSFTKRIMSDGSMLVFYANKTGNSVNFQITKDPKYKSAYLLNPMNGEVMTFSDNSISLDGFGSIILYLKSNEVKEAILITKIKSNETAQQIPLSNWNMQIGDQIFTNSTLFGWLSNEKTKYAAHGVYETTADLQQPYKQVVLKLGGFTNAATVYVNDKKAGQVMLPPYELNITNFLKTGQNSLKIEVDAPLRNYFVGAYLSGDKQFGQFKGREKTLLNTGLAGPVQLLVFNDNMNIK